MNVYDLDEIYILMHMWLCYSNACSQCSSLENLK